MSTFTKTNPRLASLTKGLFILSLFGLPACGSGAAAVFGSSGGSSTPTPFQLNLSECSPPLFENIGTVPDSALTGFVPNEVTLRFTVDVAGPTNGTPLRDFFRVERTVPGSTTTIVAPIADAFFVGSQSIKLQMQVPLAVNGTYRIAVVGDLRDTTGRQLESPIAGGLKLLDGQFSPVQETVSLGNTVVGGFHMADNDTAFASFETIGTGDNSSSPRFLISTASANSSGFWTNQELVYLGPDISGANFINEVQTGGIQANRSRAVLPITEGRISSLPGSMRSVDLKAFPGRFPLNSSLVEWPELTISDNTPNKFRVDLGASGTPLAGLHVSFQAQYWPIESSQLSANSHVTVAAWWAWSNLNANEFEDYGVYFNVLESPVSSGSTDPSWNLAGAPISGSDRSVGWPFLSAWDNGKVAVLWNDAEDDLTTPGHTTGRENVFGLAVPTYGAMIYDHDAGGQLPVTEFFESGNPNVTRATDIEAFGENSLLVISVVNTTTVGARVIEFDPSGNIIPNSDSILEAPGPGVPISLSFLGGGLPVANEYFKFRFLDNQGPKAVRLDGDRFVVSWVVNDGAARQQILALYNATTKTWANSFIDLTSLVSNPGDLTDFSVKVDRLGFTTFLMEETAFSNSGTDIGKNLRSLRSGTSLLEVDFNATSGPGSLASIFANSTEVVLATTQSTTENVIQVRGNTFSDVSASGQFVVGWGERIISLPTGIATNNGTKARRFQHDMVTPATSGN